ncbi:YceI-like domain-containing protein [Algoriphagus boseongensis]|uniref:YceI-like domain-containing protein n=1 Tax=Algoriphagus boseongensis TaxID=1442587 RepID=A0A4R6T9W9_9BACT|nr:YceI family protein [Algoriphagus boseongensis]TDQ19536.1 YceI-like domain-containing protein [Algoriphagus boseongensis]
MKTTKQIGFFLAAAMITFACSKPASDTIETSEAQEVAMAEGQELTLVPTETKISWAGYKPTGRHFGKIPATEGVITVNGDQITAGKFTFDITGLKIEDIPAEDESYGKLFGHLQSADFFDAANHPTATFEITSVEPFAAGDVVSNKEEFTTEFTPKSDSDLTPANPTHWISGNLTMRGTTKNIKFPATVAMENGKLMAKAGFNIDRTAWGLSYGDEATAVDKAKDKFIYNTVSLELDVTAN